ncbi:MAG: deoxyribodipyrimidine photo-lyase [Chloroflexota bacterium]
MSMSRVHEGETLLLWFRRDLRVHDHPALIEAVGAARLLPLFVVDPALWDHPRTAPARRWFLAGSLAALDEALRARGSRLIVRHGRPEEIVPALAAEVGARIVLGSRDVTPGARRRDRAVAESLSAAGRSLRLRRGLLLAEPETLSGRTGQGYTVFTPFWKAVAAADRRSVLGAPEVLPPLPDGIESDPLPVVPRPALRDLPEPGEAAARARLDAWAAGGMAGYADHRNDLGGTPTSHLSQDLHLGLLSPVEIEARAPGAGSGEAYRRQLGWRDFYHHLLYWRPELARAPFQARYEAAFRPESADPEAAVAWREGRTGIPVVDAGMRQLSATGWLPNRARLIVASFLTRHLLLDWRVGEDHFMRTLVDGDLANNVGGWQWTAGVGTDAQPWFRIFNPVLQGERFDPDGSWVRTWVPELAKLPAPVIHRPWTLSRAEQELVKVVIGRDYPAPIVNLDEARDRALAAFKATTGEATGEATGEPAPAG